MDGKWSWLTAAADAVGGRTEQQDRVALWQAANARVVLAALADGLGGHDAGALAAQIVIDAAGELWHREAQQPRDLRDLPAQIIRTAHERIRDAGRALGADPMSTCAILSAAENIAAWAHVGDSRIYHFRNGKLISRTRDDSVVQTLADRGAITEAEMADHPDQNQLLQALGGDTRPDIHFGEAPLQTGDGFLLCSDGLWETIGSSEMAAALFERDLSSAAEALVQQAVRRGGASGDNVAVALLRPA